MNQYDSGYVGFVTARISNSVTGDGQLTEGGLVD